MQSDNLILQNVSFFISSSCIDAKSFGRNIQNHTGLDHLKSSIHPWPHATSEQAKGLANKLNQFFIKSVVNIVSKFSETPSSSLLPTCISDDEFYVYTFSILMY